MGDVSQTIPSGGDQIHVCNKRDCYFCYEMNRINQPKTIFKVLTKKYRKHLYYLKSKSKSLA